MATYADMFPYELTASPGNVTYGPTGRSAAAFPRGSEPAECRMQEASSGCRWNVSLDERVNGTTTTDGFLLLRLCEELVKLPNTSNASVGVDVATVEECGKW
ncbi:hypothetical protein PR202_ga18901 [Eleusine coracana subsp. coracana]|uniref:Uncharacterized protein n=1 Tax=Eleusine coracana subsp. coracana TaxID=191504 RepID=A0AAV5CT23_ELECO|nr:hypothetical protein PR202_ga18901 [Eleusine coracana subsp. coracana]